MKLSFKLGEKKDAYGQKPIFKEGFFVVENPRFTNQQGNGCVGVSYDVLDLYVDGHKAPDDINPQIAFAETLSAYLCGECSESGYLSFSEGWDEFFPELCAMRKYEGGVLTEFPFIEGSCAWTMRLEFASEDAKFYAPVSKYTEGLMLDGNNELLTTFDAFIANAKCTEAGLMLLDEKQCIYGEEAMLDFVKDAGLAKVLKVGREHSAPKDKKIELKVASGKTMTAEVIDDAIYVYLEDDDGECLQNIATISAITNGAGVQKPGHYVVSVFNDGDGEFDGATECRVDEKGVA